MSLIMRTVLATITLLWIGPTASALAEALPVDEVAAGVFVSAGLPEYADRDNHGDVAIAGFIVGAEPVAFIDTGISTSIGPRLREAIQLPADLPIRYVI